MANRKTPMVNYLSLFSGIGGFELGIQQAYDLQNLSYPEEQQHETAHTVHSQGRVDTDGAKRLGYPVCVGYSEIDKYAIQIYERHFPEHKNYGDITKIEPSELPDFDFLCGGFPCQSFSIAGKRGGFEDTRGTLFFNIARILKVKMPLVFLLENVKGLLSHDNGRTFKTIIATLDELGYDLQWQVLNSKNHGVPQNRERVFIVGHLRETCRPEVFPITGTNTKSIEQMNSPKHSNDRVYSIDGISPTINTMQGGMRQPFISKTIRSGGRKSPHGSKQNWDSYEIEGKIRRLTPTECERLQGFPSFIHWTEWKEDGNIGYMTRDELIACALASKTIEVDAKMGFVFVLRGPGGIKTAPRKVGTECNGYLVANLSANGVKKQIKLHRIVWISVNGLPPKGMAVCHRNNNKKDNRIDNLYLATPEKNTIDASVDGLLKGRGAKIDFEIAQNIRVDYATEKYTMRSLAEKYGISKSRIGQIVNMQGWTEGISDTQRYKCLGNAVTVNVVRDIIKRLW